MNPAGELTLLAGQLLNMKRKRPPLAILFARPGKILSLFCVGEQNGNVLEEFAPFLLKSGIRRRASRDQPGLLGESQRVSGQGHEG